MYLKPNQPRIILLTTGFDLGARFDAANDVYHASLAIFRPKITNTSTSATSVTGEMANHC